MAIGDVYFEGYSAAFVEYVATGPPVPGYSAGFPAWLKYRLSVPDVSTSTQFSGFAHEHEIVLGIQNLSAALSLPHVLPFQLVVEIHDDLAESNLLFRQTIGGNITITALTAAGFAYRIDAYSFTHSVTTDRVTFEGTAATVPELDNDCPTEYDNGESQGLLADDGYYHFRIITPGTNLGEHFFGRGGIITAYDAVIIFLFKSAPYKQDYQNSNVVKLSYQYLPTDYSNGLLQYTYRAPFYDAEAHPEFKLRRGVPPSKFGMFTDIAGALHSAVNTGSSVQVYKFKDGLATREARSLLPNLKNPSYWSDDTGTRYICAQETTGTGTWYVYRSNGDGREFVQVASNWSDGYSGGNEFALVDGGAGSVKIKNNTDPAQVWFRRSPDGSVWPASAPYAPVLVGTLGADHKSITGHQKTESGESTIVVSNGYDKTWRSDANGAAGSWVLDA